MVLLDSQEFAPKRYLDRFSRFCTARTQRIQRHTDTRHVTRGRRFKSAVHILR